MLDRDPNPPAPEWSVEDLAALAAGSALDPLTPPPGWSRATLADVHGRMLRRAWGEVLRRSREDAPGSVVVVEPIVVPRDFAEALAVVEAEDGGETALRVLPLPLAVVLADLVDRWPELADSLAQIAETPGVVAIVGRSPGGCTVTSRPTD